ncbi:MULTISPECIES: hypothetical protein [Oligella]|uniref:Uncharacterized protein n=1 Tax=Oligella urethralis TaxID=90245 RepID=A0A2X1WMQ1_9BURK|nr:MULTISPECIES: hypothetical protein [Oligella]OFV46710.1 hypothetical protein HMPREF3179_09455 [Oligella sp. HMSC09E12]SPY08005.1 Uncharacterised protein [Oligella urethralis]
MEGNINEIPSWVSLITTYLGVPLGVAVILAIAWVSIKLAWNLYKVHDARSDGSVSSFEHLNRILENRDREVERLTRLASEANDRAAEAYKERNDAVANARAQEVRIEILTEQINVQSKRIKELEQQVMELTNKVTELLEVVHENSN